MSDRYSRTRHRSFLGEMNLNAPRADYSLSFRPTGGTEEPPNRYACLYLRINAEEVKTQGSRRRYQLP
jgi:hypothetical protein